MLDKPIHQAVAILEDALVDRYGCIWHQLLNYASEQRCQTLLEMTIFSFHLLSDLLHEGQTIAQSFWGTDLEITSQLEPRGNPCPWRNVFQEKSDNAQGLSVQ